MELTMSKILKEHLEMVKENAGTDAGVEMLELSMTPQNYYAANTYLVALNHIQRLEARLKEAEAVMESITSFPHYAYGDNEAACSMVAVASQLLKKWKGATEQIP